MSKALESRLEKLERRTLRPQGLPASSEVVVEAFGYIGPLTLAQVTRLRELEAIRPKRITVAWADAYVDVLEGEA